MNWARIAGSPDWEELWESHEVRKKLEHHAGELLRNEDGNAERARGALEFAHFLQTLPNYEAQRRAAPDKPIERVSKLTWLYKLVRSITDAGTKPEEASSVRV